MLFVRPKKSTVSLVALLAGTASAARAGTILTYTFTNDATSLISSDNTYTAKADPGTKAGGAATVLGVVFDQGSVTGSGTASTYTAPGVTYVNTGGAASLLLNGGNAFDAPTGAVAGLVSDMVYTGVNATTGAGNVTTLTFTGLTAGVAYSARIYYRQWDADTNGRPSLINFDEDALGALGASAGTVQEDAPASGPADGIANVIGYNYTAVSDGAGGALPLVVTLTEGDNNNSWHLYGMTNQVVPVPEPTLALLSLAAFPMLRRRRRST